MIRALVTGAGGMLGRDLVAALRDAPGFDVVGLRRDELDLREPTAVRAAVAGADVVVNAAAWTDVDGAEADEAAATAVNGTAVAVLAQACADRGTRLIQISTDYVLSGSGPARAWPADAATGPVNAYGRSKLVGELATRELLPDTGYVVRTAWLYGAHGRNFVSTMLSLAQNRPSLTVVDDQHGQPTWTVELARQLVDLAAAAVAGRAAAGIYHGTAAGETTWYGFARAIFAAAGLDPDRISPVTSAQFPRPAVRPVRSVLAHDMWAAAGVPVQPDWHTQLRQALAAGVGRVAV
ncbi:dTDP-4-dehydrorhamnose reductase [Catellatospora paridis]|uniref:dTDP-4-dehydrorhamnose reductase n=1 Tax=Catellatospora paridis TaxID=1617086 RepID=UPI0012D40F5D|nr:dTDP-4-dehydrorhamnose reductase [Catellatospora paridis]